MDYNLMDAFTIVERDLVKEGMSEEDAAALIKKVIWSLICRM